MHGLDIVCGISKVSYAIPHKIFPIHWKMPISYISLKFKSSQINELVSVFETPLCLEGTSTILVVTEQSIMLYECGQWRL